MVTAAKPFKDYYELLGLKDFASSDEIRTAYRKLARQYHPDLNDGNKGAEERFKEINEAYAILSNAEKKHHFDNVLRLRKSGKSPMPEAPKRSTETARSAAQQKASQGSSQASTKSSTKTNETKASGGQASVQQKAEDKDGYSFQDLFDAFIPKKDKASEKTASKSSASEPKAKTSNDDDNMFWKKKNEASGQKSQSEQTFKEASQKVEPSVKRRGEDVTVETLITVKEAEEGTIKTVNVQHKALCKQCAGTGKFNGRLCSPCNGEGRTTRLKKIDVRIPGGVKEGSKVRVAGEGGQGLGGRENGDLFLVITIEGRSALKIDGQDVYYELAIGVVDAVLGTEAEVPTLHGNVTVTVPPLTSSGRVLRLKGQGVKRGSSSGDQLVTIAIKAPDTLSPKQRQLFEELRRL